MLRSTRSLSISLLLIAFFSSMAAAQLVPSGDTYVTGASPTTANGSSTAIVVQGSSVGKPSLSYIRFDLTPLTGIDKTQIKSAYLRVYVTAVTAAGGVDVYEVTGSPNSWAEGTLTFNTAGASNPTIGAQLGATISVPYPAGKSMYFDVEVTNALKDWLTTGNPNYGLVLKPHDTSVSVSFSSKEDTTYSQVPTIIVNLVPGAASFVSSVSAGQGISVAPLNGTGDVTVTNTGVVGVSGTANQISASASTGNVILSLANPINVDTTGNAATASNATNAGHAVTADTATNATHATNADNAANAVFAMTATSATTAGHATSADSATNADNATNLGGQPASSYARLDLANLFATGKKQTFRADTSFAGLNIASTPSNPGSLAAGDVWFSLVDHHLHFQDDQNHTLALAFTSDTLSGDGSGLINLNASNLASGTVPPGRLTGSYGIDITGTAANATHANTADTATNAGFATNAGHASTADSATNATNALNAVFATSAGSAATAANTDHATNADNATHATNSDQLGGVVAANYARRDTANTFAVGQKQTVQGNADYAGLNIAGFNMDPNTQPKVAGDLWFNNTDNVLKFQDKNGATRIIAFTDSALSGDGSALTNLNASQLANGTVPTGRLSGSYGIDITGTAANATHANTADTATNAGFATNAAHATTADSATNATNALNAVFATSAGSAATAANADHATNADNATHATNSDQLGGVVAANYARRDTANTFAVGQKQTVQGNADYAGLNIAGFASDPTNNPKSSGDLWFNNTDNVLKFQDKNGATRIIAFTDSALSGDGSALTNLNASQLANGTVPTGRLSGSYGIDITGTAANATHATNADNATNAVHATTADSATNATNALNAVFATSAGSAATATNADHATNADNATHATNSDQLGGVDAANYARRDQANTFSATQSLAPKGATSQPSNILQFNATDSGSASQSAQLLARVDGALSFQFGPTTGPIAEKASVDKNGVFTGDGSGLTNISGANVTNIPNSALQHSSVTINTGAGLSGGGNVALGGTLNLANTGVTSFNGSTGAVNGVSSVSAGNGGISIGGTAASPTIANAGVLSFNGAAGNVVAVFPLSAGPVAHQFFTSYNAGSGAFTLAQPAFADLTGTDSATSHLVYNNQANSYVAGNKQTFAASSTTAGLNLAGTALDPTGPLAAGDLWYNNAGGTNHLRFYDGTTTHSLMFRDDQIQNTQLQNSSITVTAGTGIGVGGSPVSLGGAVTISNTGVTSLTGTTNVNVSAATGAVTLSLPATINVNTTGSSASFTGNLAGDVTGTQGATSIAKLQGTTLAVSGGNAPASGQVLAFSGTQWQPASITGAGFGSQTKNTVFAAPDGVNGTPSFRAITGNDLPAATSGAFGAVRPTIVNAVTNAVNLKNASLSFSVNCAAGRFVLGGGVSTNDTAHVSVSATFPSAAGTWSATLVGDAQAGANDTVTVYAICSGN